VEREFFVLMLGSCRCSQYVRR